MIKIGKDISYLKIHACQPNTKDKLREIIENRIHKEVYDCDLNDIDTSLIRDMSYLFYWFEFDGDISNWDVSNVNNMRGMFDNSRFNGDISKWDVSKVNDMSYIFEFSKFNQDISNLKINKDFETYKMFCGCPTKEEYKQKSLQS